MGTTPFPSSIGKSIAPHLICAKPFRLKSDWMLIRWRVQSSVRPSLSVYARTGRCEGGALTTSKVKVIPGARYLPQ